MADLSESGPSGVKKRKVGKVRNPNRLTDEEMIEFLYNSDAEFEDESDHRDDRK